MTFFSRTFKPQPPRPLLDKLTRSRLLRVSRTLLTPSVHAVRMPLPTGLQTTVAFQGWLECSLFKTSSIVKANTLSSFLPYSRPTWDYNLEHISFRCCLLLYLGWKLPRSRHCVLWIWYPATHLLVQLRVSLREDSSLRSNDALQRWAQSSISPASPTEEQVWGRNTELRLDVFSGLLKTQVLI